MNTVNVIDCCDLVPWTARRRISQFRKYPVFVCRSSWTVWGNSTKTRPRRSTRTKPLKNQTSENASYVSTNPRTAWKRARLRRVRKNRLPLGLARRARFRIKPPLWSATCAIASVPTLLLRTRGLVRRARILIGAGPAFVICAENLLRRTGSRRRQNAVILGQVVRLEWMAAFQNQRICIGVRLPMRNSQVRLCSQRGFVDSTLALLVTRPHLGQFMCWLDLYSRIGRSRQVILCRLIEWQSYHTIGISLISTGTWKIGLHSK